MTSLSAIIFLTTPKRPILTALILSEVEQGGVSLAAAYSVVLIAIVLAAIGLLYSGGAFRVGDQVTGAEVYAERRSSRRWPPPARRSLRWTPRWGVCALPGRRFGRSPGCASNPSRRPAAAGLWPDGAVFPAELHDAQASSRPGLISNWDHLPEYLEGDCGLKDIADGGGPLDD